MQSTQSCKYCYQNIIIIIIMSSDNEHEQFILLYKVFTVTLFQTLQARIQ